MPRDLRLNPPIPALHPERDALLAAVRDADPADDLPALVYADWQDEHGQPEHAELIRVMVELPKARKQTAEAKARKKVLLARMKELFDTPAVAPFRAIESNVWRFKRGFVPGFRFLMEGPRTARPVPFARPDQFPALPERVPFDKLAWLGVVLPEWPTADHSAVLAALPWLRRVDALSLHTWGSAWVEPGTLAPLIASKHLGGLRTFETGMNNMYNDRGVIAASEVVGLYLAKSATGLRVLPLPDLARHVTADHSPRRSARSFLAAVEEIVSSPRAGQFTSLDGMYFLTVDTALARILLDSPHLGRIDPFRYHFGRIAAKTRAAFVERFGEPERID